jgi:sulfur carrier protein ThiS
LTKGPGLLRVTLWVPRSFVRYHRVKDERITIEASPGATVADLIRQVGLPECEFGIAVVNGNRELLSYRPMDGEMIELLPIISGG